MFVSKAKQLLTVPRIVAVSDFVQRWSGPAVASVLLLLLRAVWGWNFYGTGLGKLKNAARTANFFADLGIPAPLFHAYLVGTMETVGGIALLVGLASRFAGLALTSTMVVAYLTADREAITALFSTGDPAKFIAAAPFWFLVTTLSVVALGPGWFSGDHGIKTGLKFKQWKRDAEEYAAQ